MTPKVLVYPQDSNPYQGLLYGHMDKKITTTYLNGLTSSQTINNFLLPIQLIYYRLIGYNIFHLHWVYGFTFPGNNFFSKLLSTIYYYFILYFIKICGFKTIWTVHNVMPHTPMFINDIHARKFLSNITTIKIIHSSTTLEEMSKDCLNTTNCHIISIGNYIEIYPNRVSRLEARGVLELDDDDFVYLFLSRIEPYKGIEKLLRIFNKLKLKNAKLLIAGKCTELVLKRKLKKYDKSKKIKIIDQFIDEKDVQIYFNAADIGIFPFDKITTSSGVLMSLSFGKSIIFPRIGNLVDLPENIGIPYDRTDSKALKRSIIYAYRNPDKIRSLNANALLHAKSLSWDKIAAETAQLYKSLVG